jgi:hypothetical protein
MASQSRSGSCHPFEVTGFAASPWWAFLDELTAYLDDSLAEMFGVCPAVRPRIHFIHSCRIPAPETLGASAVHTCHMHRPSYVTRSGETQSAGSSGSDGLGLSLGR